MNERITFISIFNDINLKKIKHYNSNHPKYYDIISYTKLFSLSL